MERGISRLKKYFKVTTAARKYILETVPSGTFRSGGGDACVSHIKLPQP